jgi:hypothetical protein
MLAKIASDATIRTMVARSVMSAILLLRREARFHRAADGVHNARISAGRQPDHNAFDLMRRFSQLLKNEKRKTNITKS